jgi:hypothetical protein
MHAMFRPRFDRHARPRLIPVLLILLLGLLATLSMPAAASDVETADDPPWLVGRVSHLSGKVQILQSGGTGEDGRDSAWQDAFVNDVVTAGTVVATDGGARAEIRIGQNAFRLGGVGELAFPQLDGDGVTAQLDRGTMTIRVRQADRDLPLLVMTPNARVELAAAGRYRIDSAGTARTTVTAFEGRAVVLQGESRLVLDGGRSLQVSGTPPSFQYGTAAATGLDDWALARDARERDAETARHVSPYMTGYEELDAYGDWQVDATYGTIWTPRAVPAGWVPYRHGRWSWVRPWGWTWVDEAPWGFAPFHYGRWVHTGQRWAWWPGSYAARPVYAPALVSFAASGSNWNVSVGTGGPLVGWYPLSPWERYRPIYVRHPNYERNVNRIVVPAPIVRDKHHHHDSPNRQFGWTAVPGEVVTRTRPVARHVDGRHPNPLPAAIAPVQSAAGLPRPLHNLRPALQPQPLRPEPVPIPERRVRLPDRIAPVPRVEPIRDTPAPVRAMRPEPFQRDVPAARPLAPPNPPSVAAPPGRPLHNAPRHGVQRAEGMPPRAAAPAPGHAGQGFHGAREMRGPPPGGRPPEGNAR